MPETGQASLSSAGRTPDEEAARRLKFFKVFLLSSPPSYEGNLDQDLLEAVEWLRKVKKCLDVIAVPEDLRVQFATYTLTGAADHWWHLMKRIRSDVVSMTWEEFETLFRDKYFPQFAVGAKERELITLFQGNMTVAELEAKFLRIACHVTDLVNTDREAKRRFTDNLRPDIRRALYECDDSSDDGPEYTYNDAVVAALWQERESDPEKVAEEWVKSMQEQQNEWVKLMQGQQNEGQKTEPATARTFDWDDSSEDDGDSTYDAKVVSARAVHGSGLQDSVSGGASGPYDAKVVSAWAVHGSGLQDSVSGGASGGRGRTAGKQQKGGQRTRSGAYITCYNCGHPGHIRSHCPITTSL